MSFTSASRAISIHAPREGSDNHRCTQRFDRRISIHAPREGSDLNNLDEFKTRYKISIHAPREGSGLGRRRRRRHVGHFYPRSPRGERPICPTCKRRSKTFLSTLPARGATASGGKLRATFTVFLSTLPARGATRPDLPGQRQHNDFYPRSPRGERRYFVLSLHGKTIISIHAPREGSDIQLRIVAHERHISIHAPREGSDGIPTRRSCRQSSISIHAPREGSDRVPAGMYQRQVSISIHAPREGERRMAEQVR